VERKPEWLRKTINLKEMTDMKKMLRSFSLHTVCEGANCPNIGECFNNKTATFMILGRQCTRNCKFCNVDNNKPEEIDLDEPQKVATAAKELGLEHVVVTCVTRDDIPDGGAEQFVNTIKSINKELPNSTVEVLISDLDGKLESLKTIVAAKPDIINHNIETVPRLYDTVRPMAIYRRSLDLLKNVKELDASIFTKSGIMVGLGETKEEVLKVMDDLLAVGCDILTIGQYLKPSLEHIPIAEYIHPDQFVEYKQIGEKKGFKFVASGPLVRSSYNAIEGMNSVK